MTPQQAGVSAEAVAKLVAAWREAIVKLKDGLGDTPSYDLKRMIKERSEAFTICADELEALATVPPEQALADERTCGPSQPETLIPPERSVKVTYGKPTKEQAEKFERTAKEMIEGTPPKAASAGALDDSFALILEATPIINGQAELAAHDQKVRAEVLEEVVQIVENAFEHSWVIQDTIDAIRLLKGQS